MYTFNTQEISRVTTWRFEIAYNIFHIIYSLSKHIMNNDKVKLMRHIISDNHMCFSSNNIDINGITRTILWFSFHIALFNRISRILVCFVGTNIVFRSENSFVIRYNGLLYNLIFSSCFYYAMLIHYSPLAFVATAFLKIGYCINAKTVAIVRISMKYTVLLRNVSAEKRRKDFRELRRRVPL